MSGKIKIMSFNLWCAGKGERAMPLRVPDVVKTIETEKPDSLGVQEAHLDWIEALGALNEYSYVGVGRDDGAEAGEFSAVFYLKEKYTAEDSGTFWVSETPEVPSRSWNTACTRICTWAILKNKATGSTYAHVNTHLDHVSLLARTEGVKLILKKAEEFASKGVPCVVTGDFNDFENSVVYETMISSSMGDTKTMAADSVNLPTFEAGTVIDYVFASKKGFDVLQYRVVDKKFGKHYPSDHYPVYAVMSFK